MIEIAYVFLDANILLHFQLPDQIDWPALCRAKRVLLVVYPLLLKELLKAKDLHPNKRLRARAGEREAWLRKRLGAINQSVRPRVFLFRDAQEPRELIGELGLDREVADDLIVAHAISYHRSGRDVFVATADGGLQMKLEDQEVPVIVLDDSLRLAPEPDPEKVRADGLERELRAIRNRLPDLQASLAATCMIIKQNGYGHVDDYIRRGLETAEASYQQRQLERVRQYDWRRVETFVPDSIYNPKHKAGLAAAQRFLANQHRWVTVAEGAAQLRMVVRNAGNLTATDVRIRIFSPPHVTIYGPGGFGEQPKYYNRSEVFAGIPVESDEYDPGYYAVTGRVESAPKVNRAEGVAKFS